MVHNLKLWIEISCRKLDSTCLAQNIRLTNVPQESVVTKTEQKENDSRQTETRLHVYMERPPLIQYVYVSYRVFDRLVICRNLFLMLNYLAKKPWAHRVKHLKWCLCDFFLKNSIKIVWLLVDYGVRGQAHCYEHCPQVDESGTVCL